MEIVVSVQPQPWPEPVPEIAAAIRAMYGGRREVPLAVQVRDQLGELFSDAEFAAAFGVRGRPGFSPGLPAMITVLQKAEDLTDRQAADEVRTDLAWRYALGLELTDPGFDHTVLSGFRTRVIEHGMEEKALDLLLAALRDKGLIAAGGKARTDSTHVIAAVRDLNGLESAGEGGAGLSGIPVRGGSAPGGRGARRGGLGPTLPAADRHLAPAERADQEGRTRPGLRQRRFRAVGGGLLARLAEMATGAPGGGDPARRPDAEPHAHRGRERAGGGRAAGERHRRGRWSPARRSALDLALRHPRPLGRQAGHLLERLQGPYQ